MQIPRSVAISAAKEAGQLLLKLSEGEIRYQMKNEHDILAEADLQSETLIVEKIRRAFPTHSILSEEMGEEMHDAEYLWVIDPVDGTINFSRKLEDYAVSIALCRGGQVELGIVYQPALDKLYVAEKGKGAYLHEKKLRVSAVDTLAHALAATDNTSKMNKRIENLEVLRKLWMEVRHIRIFGSCALHLARLAEGTLDFYFKTSYNYWDFAAGILLVEESGGIVTDFAGNPPSRSLKNVVVSNGLLHPTITQIISQ